jgi:PAS domain S-box-containing protein
MRGPFPAGLEASPDGGVRMTVVSEDIVADLRQAIAELQRQLDERSAELNDALERQSATADVLRVINSSPGDLTSVFDAILEKAHKLCGVAHGSLQLYDGGRVRAVAVHGLSQAFADRLRQGYVPGPNMPTRRLLEGGRFAQVPDIGEIDDPMARAALELSGIRTTLFIPLRKDGTFLGQIVAARREVRPFAEKEIALLESFAAQAVIAMENARLLNELRERTDDLQQSLMYQTATSDVLKVISRSTFDLDPVLETVTATAARLCEAEMGFVSRRDGSAFRFITAVGSTPETTADALRLKQTLFDTRAFVAGRATITGRVVLEGRAVQIADITADPEYTLTEAITVARIRTILGVPLMREGETIGTFTLARQRVEPFTERQIALVRTFADQAVIAIENTRLVNEQREALERQTATAEVLQVINSSPGDLAPVFEAMLEKAMRLCEAAFGQLATYDGERFRTAATRGVPIAFAEYRRRNPPEYGPGTTPARILAGERVICTDDLKAESAYRSGEPNRRAFVDLGGARSAVIVALRKDDAVLGFIEIYRQEVRPFTDKQSALLQNFAAQAVIAMENARLITETREALEQQTATAEVLKLISRSSFDLGPVLDALVETAARICNAEQGTIWRKDGDVFTALGSYGRSEDVTRLISDSHPRIDRGTCVGRTILEGHPVHILDVRRDPEYTWPEVVDRAGFRTMLGVPLLREGIPIGAFSLQRLEVRPFTGKQIELVTTFADQAVIAIENVRLVTETREALERQTATAEVLQVINSSPGDLTPVFDAILQKAHSLCDVAYGSLQIYDGERFSAVAVHNLPEQFADLLRQGFRGADHPAGRALLDGDRLVHIVDCATFDHPVMQGAVELAGIRTALFVPLRRDDALLGVIVAARREVRPFSDKQIALLESFAAQAVIAMENARLINETREALEQQTATAEVLQVINESPGNLAPVFEAMLEKALTLCNASFGQLLTFDGARFRAVAWRDYEPGSEGTKPTPGMALYHLVEGEQVVHITDITADDVYRSGNAVRRRLADEYGARTAIWVALRKEAALLGAFVIYRTEVRPFSDKQIALLQNFAAQAVIAIENARLITETREALERQTATAEVLGVINSSQGDLQPVFEAMLDKALGLCGAAFGALWTYDGERLHAAALRGMLPEFAEFLTHSPHPAGGENAHARLLRGEAVVHIADVREDQAYHSGDPVRRALVELGGGRTLLAVPLRRDERFLGDFVIYRREVRPFNDKQIELVATFADQAVIAIENARLLSELRSRTSDLQESLEYQTATSDVLKVISQSGAELGPVLDTLVETAARICRAESGFIFRLRDGLCRMVASFGIPGEYRDFQLRNPIAPGRGTLAGRTVLERHVVHIEDAAADPEYTRVEAVQLGHQRTMLGVPLIREDALIGVITLARSRVESFTERQIELVRTFADQAVIAIENARLFDELRERQAELRVTFDNMGDGVVMFDAGARLAAWNRNFEQILDLPDAFLAERPSYAEYFRYLAERGEYSSDLEAQLSRTLEDTRREMRFERTRPDGRVIEVRRNPVPGGGFVLIYSDITERKRAEAAISAARDAAEMALRELQAAQASLLHAQKMAALGQLTAGIAHEIKNPLNFVNNFAGLSVELLDELKAAAAPAISALDDERRAEIDEAVEMLTGNLAKIAEHGHRADGIVKSMLAHSRGTSGDRQQVDINALVEESLNLAYHGARAQDQNFNITLERDFGAAIAPIELVPQDITRVFLNLFGNGFYAANKRRQKMEDATFKPTLRVTTRELGGAIEIAVRDNGIGIAPEHREKLFQPFFTTKPTGEGTGLGLSISYDIVTQEHGGTIAVDSRVGKYTEFTIRLPRASTSARKDA